MDDELSKCSSEEVCWWCDDDNDDDDNDDDVVLVGRRCKKGKRVADERTKEWMRQSQAAV